MNVTPLFCASVSHYDSTTGAPGPSLGGFESVVIRIAACAALWLFIPTSVYSEELGLFDNQMDVGRVTRPGSTSFDPSSRSYSVAGGGENMWFTNDAFHFVWTRVSGDFALRAAIEWLGAGGNP